MHRCRYVQSCAFFHDEMSGLPSISSVLRRHYCHGHYADCARFKVAVALGPDAVPEDMLPSQTARVAAVLGLQDRAG